SKRAARHSSPAASRASSTRTPARPRMGSSSSDKLHAPGSRLQGPDILVYWIVDCASGGMNIHSAEKSVPGPHPRLAIQVRDKAASGRELYENVRAWVNRGYRVYVNDRVDVALAVGAEGVQLPGGGLAPREVRALAPLLKVGMSIHSADEATAEA